MPELSPNPGTPDAVFASRPSEPLITTSIPRPTMLVHHSSKDPGGPSGPAGWKNAPARPLPRPQWGRRNSDIRRLPTLPDFTCSRNDRGNHMRKPWLLAWPKDFGAFAPAPPKCGKVGDFSSERRD